MAAILKSKMTAKTQITAWQTTYHGFEGSNEYFDTICQLLPKMFSGTFILSFCPLTTRTVQGLGEEFLSATVLLSRPLLRSRDQDRELWAQVSGGSSL